MASLIVTNTLDVNGKRKKFEPLLIVERCTCLEIKDEHGLERNEEHG